MGRAKTGTHPIKMKACYHNFERVISSLLWHVQLWKYQPLKNFAQAFRKFAKMPEPIVVILIEN